MSKDIYDHHHHFIFGGLSKIGYVMMVLGAFVLISPVWLTGQHWDAKTVVVGMITIGAGALLSFTYKGLRWDFTNKRWQEYVSLIGVKLGKWETIPPFTGMAVYEKSFHSSHISNGISPTWSGKTTIYQVSLFINDSQPETILDIANLQKAKKEAQILSAGLNISLIDHFEP